MKPKKKHIIREMLKAKGSGFKVPKSYFDSVETMVFAKLSDDIPQNYFNTLEERVFDKINKEASVDVKVLSLKQKIIKRYVPILAAASVVLFIGLNFYNTSNTLSFDSLDTVNISTWLEDTNYNASDSYVLGELLDTDDISNLTASNETSLDDTQLLDYLNKTDIEDLIINN